jgi:octopine/nopaline transport system substrate-binding protein
MRSNFTKSAILGLAAALCISNALAKNWKAVVIAMEGAYEPWNLTDSSGKIVGFEVDLANDICKRAGVECKIIAQDWDGMIPGLQAGKFDVIMDGLSITEPRMKQITFSRPYATTPAVFMARKDSPLAKANDAGKIINLTRDPSAGDGAIKMVQAALTGKTIGVQASTTHANFANKYLKDATTVKEYKTTDARDLDLKSGRIDAVLDAYPTIAAAADKPDAKDFAIVGPEFAGGVFGVGVGLGIRKSDADLASKFNVALDQAFADGSVKNYSIRWFKIDTTP